MVAHVRNRTRSGRLGWLHPRHAERLDAGQAHTRPALSNPATLRPVARDHRRQILQALSLRSFTDDHNPARMPTQQARAQPHDTPSPLLTLERQAEARRHYGKNMSMTGKRQTGRTPAVVLQRLVRCDHVTASCGACPHAVCHTEERRFCGGWCCIRNLTQKCVSRNDLTQASLTPDQRSATPQRLAQWLVTTAAKSCRPSASGV